jgi:tagaturonate reductase
MLDEIVPTLDAPGSEGYARAVLERFANPYVRHALNDISLQQTMKMRVRVVPTIVRYAERMARVPDSLAFGFAAYLLFVREGLGLADDQAERVRGHWSRLGDRAEPEVARDVCGDAELWGTDLSRVPGFTAAVAGALVRMRRHGVPAALEAHLAATAAA